MTSDKYVNPVRCYRKLVANSADPDQTALKEQSGLDLALFAYWGC